MGWQETVIQHKTSMKRKEEKKRKNKQMG
uniref:Uncharacterized protein n=1 Tax=Physcomitrium patens TaxID=3218 RepID=A0A2K1IIS3_PHYPA|nr:hypothetical protein PHYPA_027866 [Physcomitrium patens]